MVCFFKERHTVKGRYIDSYHHILFTIIRLWPKMFRLVATSSILFWRPIPCDLIMWPRVWDGHVTCFYYSKTIILKMSQFLFTGTQIKLWNQQFSILHFFLFFPQICPMNGKLAILCFLGPKWSILRYQQTFSNFPFSKLHFSIFQICQKKWKIGHFLVYLDPNEVY